jgi:hypothetical protein
MKTASDLKQSAPPARAHQKGRARGGRGGPKARRLAIAGLRRRRLGHAHHLRGRRPAPAYAPRVQPVQPDRPVQPDQPGNIASDDHETAVESAMPAVTARAGLSLYSAVTVPIASLVACVYIGVPLALFTHDFSDHRLLATLVASALVFAAAFGGVLRVLRMTTPATAARLSGGAKRRRAVTRLASPAFAHLGIQARDYPHFVEV